MAKVMTFGAFATALVKINKGIDPEMALTRKELAGKLGVPLEEVTAHVGRIRSTLKKAGEVIPVNLRVQDEDRGRKPGASAEDLLAIAEG